MTSELISTNDAFKTAAPKLSVLIPFYKESPVPLLAALEACEVDWPQCFEFILLDDGSMMNLLSSETLDFITTMRLPVKLISLSANEGRAKGRNRLSLEARAPYYLFLDSDMIPDRPDFLQTWLETVEQEPDVVFGGFSLRQAPCEARYDLHKAMASHSDCLDVATRRLQPEKHVFTSNLLIKAKIMEEEDFDPEFTGWGWEDVEWGMRISKRFRIEHIDNTATHMGLDTAPILIKKYTQSVKNFKRVLTKHPQILMGYPSYIWAKRFKWLPFRPLWRSLFQSLALNEAVPLGLRALSMRCYRASLYAQVI